MYRDIPGYEGVYAISRTGQILSRARPGVWRDRIMRPHQDKDGYFKIGLRKPNTPRSQGADTLRVGRLVALTQIPNPKNLPFINHINGEKTDDRVENLEWVTAQRNTQHAWEKGLIKAYDRTKPYNVQGIRDGNKKRIKLTEEQKFEIAKSTLPSKVLAKQYNTTSNTINTYRSMYRRKLKCGI